MQSIAQSVASAKRGASSQSSVRPMLGPVLRHQGAGRGGHQIVGREHRGFVQQQAGRRKRSTVMVVGPGKGSRTSSSRDSRVGRVVLHALPARAVWVRFPDEFDRAYYDRRTAPALNAHVTSSPENPARFNPEPDDGKRSFTQDQRSRASTFTAHNGTLVELSAKLNRRLAFNPKDQYARFRRPRPIVADPLP